MAGINPHPNNALPPAQPVPSAAPAAAPAPAARAAAAPKAPATPADRNATQADGQAGTVGLPEPLKAEMATLLHDVEGLFEAIIQLASHADERAPAGKGAAAPARPAERPAPTGSAKAAGVVPGAAPGGPAASANAAPAGKTAHGGLPDRLKGDMATLLKDLEGLVEAIARPGGQDPVKAEPANPDDAVVAAEQPLEPALLAKVAGVLKASPAAAEQQIEGLYAAIAAAAAPKVATAIDEQVGQATIAEVARHAPEVNAKYPELARYVQGVADRLSQAAGVAPFKVHLLESNQDNAFNPGGHSIGVYLGEFPTLHNEAELAGVLAHEMTHGLKRHMVQSGVMYHAAQAAEALVVQQNPMSAAETAMVDDAMAKQPDADAVLAALRGKVRPGVLTDLQFLENNRRAGYALRRHEESEADAGGARILSKAGYDPNALISLMRRWSDSPGDVRLMDHPRPGQRIADLQAQIAREKLAVGPMRTNATSYQQAIAVLMDAPTLA